jgi:hypothetical protein
MNSSKTARKEDLDLIIKLKNNEQNLKYEITKLKKELHRNNEEWEKKFDVLKNRYIIIFFLFKSNAYLIYILYTVYMPSKTKCI